VTIARAPSGHRCGASHPRAKHPDATVRQARDLRAQGLSYESIELVVGVPWRTVADWCQYVTRRSA
jgi:transposase-like protein